MGGGAGKLDKRGQRPLTAQLPRQISLQPFRVKNLTIKKPVRPEHHAIHHTPPYDTHYCITSGITNGALAKVGFWPVLLASCRRLGRHLPGSPATGEGSQGPGA